MRTIRTGGVLHGGGKIAGLGGHERQHRGPRTAVAQLATFAGERFRAEPTTFQAAVPNKRPPDCHVLIVGADQNGLVLAAGLARGRRARTAGLSKQLIPPADAAGCLAAQKRQFGTQFRR